MSDLPTSSDLAPLHLQPGEVGLQVGDQLVVVRAVPSSLTAAHTANRKRRRQKKRSANDSVCVNSDTKHNT